LHSLIKSELLRVLREKFPQLQANDIELALNCLLEHMISALESGERIEIRGFGSFNLHQHAPRIGRNPKTGAAVNLSAKIKLHFKPAKEMSDRVNAARNKRPITN
jgi:integration host factor subunit beta